MTQKEALDILKLGHNVFLTGSAGSGKTYLLNRYINYLKKKKVGIGITASTGIAATHLNGITIHSWSGLGAKDQSEALNMKKLLVNIRLRTRFKKTQVLIIDEISMLHAFQLDRVNKICQAFKNSNEPFGGMQVILCGDLFQLPPVSAGSTASRFVHRSNVWEEMNIKICYLDEQYRQLDKKFIQILNSIRQNNVDQKKVDLLLGRSVHSNSKIDVVTKLYTHNVDVDRINHLRLDAIRGTEQRYPMRSEGVENIVNSLKRGCLAPEELILKKGAVVMFLKNNFDQGYVNGTLGEVIGFNDDGAPIVKIKSGNKIVVTPACWLIEERGDILASIYQLPLRLAWAITVHKSQGMSLDEAEIDLSKCFVHGMGYVALSRIRTLNGLFLRGLNELALMVSPEIVELNKEFIKISKAEVKKLEQLKLLDKKMLQSKFVKSALVRKKKAVNSDIQVEFSF